MLIDKYNRQHNYLRISLTERCNLRCTYCMPEDGIPLRDRMEFMTREEIFFLAKTFVKLGVTKIRLTGGEPLIKKNFSDILSDLSKLNVELAITTNGVQLHRFWDDLLAAKVKSLNISLDTLFPEKNKTITRRDYFQKTYENIKGAVERGFDIKLNCVLIKGFNDDEIIDFIELSKSQNIGIRFIEFMPFDGNKWDLSKTVSFQEIIKKTRDHFGDENVTASNQGPNSTSRNYRINNYTGDFGIISSITNPFCDSCNRIRLTADGKIKNCLFSNSETDLLTALRREENIEDLIRTTIFRKEKERAGLPDFNDPDFSSENRSMIQIGG